MWSRSVCQAYIGRGDAPPLACFCLLPFVVANVLECEDGCGGVGICILRDGLGTQAISNIRVAHTQHEAVNVYYAAGFSRCFLSWPLQGNKITNAAISPTHGESESVERFLVLRLRRVQG